MATEPLLPPDTVAGLLVPLADSAATPPATAPPTSAPATAAIAATRLAVNSTIGTRENAFGRPNTNVSR